MNMNDVLQYAAYVLVAIGVMAFLVSVITQVIKELPCFKPVPTAVVVIVLSLVLCPAAIGGANGLAVSADYLVSDFCLHDCRLYRGTGCNGWLGKSC